MTSPGFPVAVVGMGCRFPGARGPQEFWRLLMDGADVVTEVPAARTDHPQLFPAAPGRSRRYGGFLDDVAGFDALFFGISSREAERMDPQQRLLLEVAWEALEDAQLPPPSLAGSRTGVFVGQMGRDYWELQARHSEVDIHALTGSGLLSFASGRLSFVLDLRGPSVSVDTACSSSLTAVHLACQSLCSGDSDTALAAGVNLVLIPELGALYERVKMIASHGRCRFGDASADGFVRSEGAGVVVLRPLDRALADGDRIYAVIAGSAVNNDGRASGSLVTPSREGQEAVLRHALARAGVDPAAVGYVEAHGTGTRVGDAVELRALSAVLGAGRPPDKPCLVGSVKTNLGHSEGAAGIAGFIKTALSVYHERIPGSLLLADPNPALSEAGASLRVPPGPVPWPAGTSAAGVASFGLSGTNVHVILTAAPRPATPRFLPLRPLLLPLSARDPAALRELADAYAGRLAGADAAHAARVCAAAARGRAHHRLRATAIADDGVGLAAALRALPPDAAAGPVTPRPAGPPRVVFIFPSHRDVPGYRAVLDARRVLPAVRATLDACDKAAGYEIARSSPEGLVMLWAMQVALAAHWQASGVRPDVVIGCGPGEIAAAQVAGLIAPGIAARLACPDHGLAGPRYTAGRVPMPRDASVFRSAIAGQVMMGAELDATHWAEVLQGPDRQADLAAAVAAEAAGSGPAHVVFLEIGATPALSGQIRLALADSGAKNATALPGQRPGSGQPGSDALVRLVIATTASLYEAGADISWENYYPHRAAAEPIPTYPWQRKQVWFQTEG
ncbi:MAG: beta-ketoacyl synthase N-terminal-like domain-containing protein [Streptosporangiaceae bacterium]